jgi:hypothetical protein
MRDPKKREDFNDELNNTYVIRRRLAELTREDNKTSFTYYVGDFMVDIYTTDIHDNKFPPEDDRVTKHSKLEVALWELQRSKLTNKPLYSTVFLEVDSRFKNYQPIKYHEFPGYSDGRNMPLNHLCELIRHLHKLTKLAVFA